MSENYDKATTEKIVEAYTAGETDAERAAILESLAAEHGKTVPSLRAKLVREGVYIAKTYKGKNGEKPEKKEDIVQDIANLIAVPSTVLTGLEKATKNCLLALRSEFRALNETD